MTWPFLRYETTNVELENNLAPTFSNESGISYYNEALNDYEYMVNNRFHPSTTARWEIQNIKKAQKNTIRSFWETTLSRGEYDLTLIDHRKRLLFETSWNQWKTRFSKKNGGIGSVFCDFESSVDWTAPCFAMYTMAENNLNDHCLDSASNLSLVDGSLVNKAGDANILRNNGYALKLIGDGNIQTGASGTVSWPKGDSYNNLSIFFQFRTGETGTTAPTPLTLVNLTDGTDYVRVDAVNNDGSSFAITGRIRTGGTVVTVIGDVTWPQGLIDTWYDVMLTYDAIHSNVYVYYIATDTGATFTDFLYGLTDISDGIASTLTPSSVYPSDTTWTTVELLKEQSAQALKTGENAHLQNVMIFDDFIPPSQFNTLRRLAYMWNSKTVSYPK